MSLQAELRETAQPTTRDLSAAPGIVTYASWSKRFSAHQIDMSFPAPYFVISLVLTAKALTGGIDNGLLPSVMIFLAMILASFGVVVSFYNRCIVMGLTGQSWGKKSAGLRLVSARTGEPIGVAKAIIREMARMADVVVLGMGLLMPIWDGKRQTLADKITGAVVVEASQPMMQHEPLVIQH